MKGPDAVLDELTRILLRLDGFRDERTRQVLLEELAAETGEQIEVGGDPLQQARSLIRQCARRPDVMPVLVDLLRDFHGDIAETLRFRELTPRLASPPLLTGDERDELLSMLHPRENDGWRGAYAWAAPLVPERPDDLRHALELLEDLISPSRDVPPLVRFVLALADRSAPHDRRRLREWAGRVAERLGVPAVRLTGPTVPDRPGPRESVTLVLRLQPFLPRRPEYLLSVWLGHGGRQWMPLVHEDEPQRLDQISARIDDFLVTAREYDRDGPSRIEFMLPRELINLPVEQWQVSESADGPEQPLGCLYPVVVRDQDRQRDPDVRRLWEAKWRRLRHEHLDASSSLLLDAEHPASGRHDLVPRMMPALTVLVAGTAAWEDRGDTLQEHLEAALEAGVPIMLWDRGGGSRSTRYFKERLAPELADEGGRARLPHTILDFRRRSAGLEDARRFADLALLWDDPEHSPVQAGGFHAPL
ncbi:hypothetical protein F9278_45905 [Streptomyces phaeolivaceus]|uniref:Uncharacterized protein n=1 Tax=Streptomyces phaeolivaceus TaxID=2653200 RepID=A0A5P8KGZ4_9ACTN|nr:hypothetical protein [Streptomyces phaeolivaceus]QFR02267.1 hypothetical protein F9278_45905 [Streptomyces phaeolivaceus]